MIKLRSDGFEIHWVRLYESPAYPGEARKSVGKLETDEIAMILERYTLCDSLKRETYWFKVLHNEKVAFIEVHSGFQFADRYLEKVC